MIHPSHSRTFMPLAFLAAVAATCLQGAAFAGEVPLSANGKTIAIPLADYNLASPADRARLDSQIAFAARTVCLPESNRDLRGMAKRPACEEAAISSARTKRDQIVARYEAAQLASGAGDRTTSTN